MAALPASTQSFWIDSTDPTFYPGAIPVTVDVAIVGGGIAGITAAKKFKEAGKTVALIEGDRICRGSTGKTTAKVTSLHRAIYAELIDSKGEAKARLYGQSAQNALEQITSWVEQENIDCDFSRLSAYTFGASEKDLSTIKDEYEAAKLLGLPAEYVTETSLPFGIAGAIEFKNQAQFHSRKYILHLAQALPGDGSYVFENTRVSNVKEEESGVRVLTGPDCKGAIINAQQVLLTTNIPISDEGLFFAKAYPKRSYIIGLPIGADDGPDGMFIGSGSDDHSIRTTPYKDGKLLLIGGASHKAGEKSDTEANYQKLADYAQKKFGLTDIAYRWSSQDMVSFDKVPYVGKLTPASNRTYIATGFSLWGMTNGTAAGLVLADQVLGIENPYSELYDSLRTGSMVNQTSLKENLDVGASWVGDRLKGLLRNSFDEVKPGEGKILTQAEGKVAAYRDESGEVYACSAVCTHLGCIVNWNEAEKSWDCPCHGARFDTSGKVLRAPAVEDLEPIKLS